MCGSLAVGRTIVRRATAAASRCGHGRCRCSGRSSTTRSTQTRTRGCAPQHSRVHARTHTGTQTRPHTGTHTRLHTRTLTHTRTHKNSHSHALAHALARTHARSAHTRTHCTHTRTHCIHARTHCTHTLHAHTARTHARTARARTHALALHARALGRSSSSGRMCWTSFEPGRPRLLAAAQKSLSRRVMRSISTSQRRDRVPAAAATGQQLVACGASSEAANEPFMIHIWLP